MSARAQPAAERPDAGTLSRDGLELPPPAPSPGALMEQPVADDAAVPPGGAEITVSSIAITGNTIFGDAVLLAVLGDYVGRSFDLSGLQGLATAVAQYYRDSGYPFVQAGLPPQDVTGGGLTIEVIEGRYGDVQATGTDEALVATAQRYLAGLKPGDVIAESTLERSVMVLSDLPGVDVDPVLRPGRQSGTGDLDVGVAPGPRWSVALRVDNHGNRFSGIYRSRADLTVNRLLSVVDRMVLSGLYTDEDLGLGSLEYSAPVGVSGLRASAGIARTDYQLGRGFTGFSGTATEASLGLSYPLVRSSTGNASLTGRVVAKRLEDALRGVVFDRKDAYVGVLGLNFDYRDTWWRDSWLGAGGITFGGVSVTAGRIDAHTPFGSDSDFIKLNGDIARLQSLTDRFSGYGAVRFQLGHDLDGSETFSLGGANRVRSFPSGEASASTGILAQTELRYTLNVPGNVPGDVTGDVSGPHALESFVLFDIGHAAAGNGTDARTLAGAGIGLRYSYGGFNADAALVWRITGGDARSDDRQEDPRLWLSVTYRF